MSVVNTCNFFLSSAPVVFEPLKLLKLLELRVILCGDDGVKNLALLIFIVGSLLSFPFRDIPPCIPRNFYLSWALKPLYPLW